MRTQLLPHNKIAYQKILKAFETSDRTCVVHPTGTGKSFLMAATSELYRNVLILGPNVFVLDQVHEVMKWRKEGIEYMTYSFLMMKDVMPTGYDLICLDEFHRAGAPEWGVAVDRLLEANSQAKVLGTTATPIRFLDDNRDMADELFGGNIASYMTLKDAWDRNILAVPRFVTGLFEFEKVADDMIERVRRSQLIDESEKRVRMTRINNLRLDWEKSQGMPQIIRKHIDRTAKRIIVFCGNVEKLKDMEQTIRMWFDKAGIKVASVYMVHAYMPDKELLQAMEDFEKDSNDGVKLMLSVNMLNEGVHIPRVNAVILLRTTSSKIIYLQQIGRCLTAEKKDKPIILDMVDNITTTNILHDIKEEYDWYEHQNLKDEETVSHEPIKFVVYDYTLGIQDAIRKLVPNDHKRVPFEVRYAKALSFCKKYGRLPEKGDLKEEVSNWESLRVWHGERKEVVDLRNKYGKVKNKNYRYEQLMRFIEANDRLPRFKYEQEEYANYMTLIAQHKKNYDENIQAIIDKYVRKKLSDEELLQYFIDFVNTNNRLPSSNYEKAPKEELNLRKRVHDRLSNHPKVVELLEKYAKIKFIPFEERLSQLKSFIEKNDRLPFRKDGEYEWNNLQQLRRLNKKENYPELCEIFAKYNMFKSDEELKQIILDFYSKHGRLPYKRSDHKESALAKTFNLRKSIHSDPEIAKLLETRRKQLTLEERIKILQDYTSEHGQRPPTGDTYMHNMWIRTVTRSSSKKDPRVKVLYEKYGGKPNLRMKEYIAPLKEFIQKHHRLPQRKNGIEEYHKYAILVNLRKRYADHPDVKPLLEGIASWPSPGDALRAKNDEDVKRKIIVFVDEHHRLPRYCSEYTSESALAKQWAARRDRLCQNDPVMQAILDQYDNRPLKFEERYALIRDWAAEHGRLPKKADKEVYEKWCTLNRGYRNTPEVKALREKYGLIDMGARGDITGMLEEIVAWTDKHNRMPSPASKDRVEKRLGGRWHRIKRFHGDHQIVVMLRERFPIQNRK